jgi:arylsulfatase A-like enzyme
MLRSIAFLSVMIVAASLCCGAGPSTRPNVLFIAVDDLRPQLHCYGQTQMITPNFDRLAARGMLFERAYCQQAVCAPSRVSLLTGCRPDITKVTDLKTPLPTVRPDLVTLPKHFRDNGYATVSLGKIFHHGQTDDPNGFSEEVWQPAGGSAAYATEASRQLVEERRKTAAPDARVKGPPVERADVADAAYPDAKVAERAIEYLAKLKDRPFFLAVGFYRPHLPFNAPKKYWDLYDPASINLSDQPVRAKDAPAIAFTSFGELRGYAGMPAQGPIDDMQARELIHGYYASVSYLDAQLGKVLDALNAQGLADNTIIVLWGDHGWHLGDQGMWCKHTNFEIATRVPLFIAGPSITPGTRTRALTELIDVYPSLCDLAGLSKPQQLEGESFVPLLQKPDLTGKRAAFSLYPHEGRMGYSVRTDRWRFTRWAPKRGTKAAFELELYDHQDNDRESVNVAGDARYAQVVKELSAMLDEHQARNAVKETRTR